MSSSIKSSLCNLEVMLNRSLSLGCYVRSGTCLFHLRGIFLLQNFGMSCPHLVLLIQMGILKNGQSQALGSLCLTLSCSCVRFVVLLLFNVSSLGIRHFVTLPVKNKLVYFIQL